MTIVKLCGSQQMLIPFFFLFPNGQILLEAMRESFICNDIQTGAAAANKLLPDPPTALAFDVFPIDKAGTPESCSCSFLSCSVLTTSPGTSLLLQNRKIQLLNPKVRKPSC